MRLFIYDEKMKTQLIFLLFSHFDPSSHFHFHITKRKHLQNEENSDERRNIHYFLKIKNVLIGMIINFSIFYFSFKISQKKKPQI